MSLSGGLGNQLFQLAAAISLSDTLGCGVGVFVEPNLPGNTPRELELQSLLGPGVEVVSSKQVSTWHEEQWGYDDRFWQIERGTHLVGGFQSWRYALPAASRIRQGLFRSDSFSRGFESIQGEKVIACHLRRGDYLSPRARLHHGFTRARWHVKAVSALREKLGMNRVRIFSESTCISRLMAFRLGSASRAPSDANALETLGELAACSGFSLSNSSLGWWGAFLSSEALGTPGSVIAPSQWFLGRQIRIEDLLPSGWQLMPKALTAGLAGNGRKILRHLAHYARIR